MSEIKNYKIISTHLGYEDHGIFTFYLNLKGADDIHVSVGGYALEQRESKAIDDYIIVAAKDATLIANILDTVGVANWEELKGKYIRAVDNGLGTYVTKFGNLIEDKWIDLEDYFKGDPFDRGINEKLDISKMDKTTFNQSEMEFENKLRNAYYPPNFIRNSLDYKEWVKMNLNKGGDEDDIHQAESENCKPC